MGINSGYILGASDKATERLTKKHGKNYMNIDFELNESYDYKSDSSQPIGQLVVGNKRISLSFGDINKVVETLHDAQVAHKNTYRLGLHRN